ncbi:MAG: MgtC/SapB family protein [Alphaproteobacteria bacterium]|nr:MgtC/SapB family protein [Alphaproteobacteria bacterium]
MLDTIFTHENLTVLSHISYAILAGAFIGFERSYYGRPAGFRTHTLVCLSSSLLMVLTVNQLEWMGTSPQDIVKTDPTRLAQGIMTGIGFLGAGVIYKEGFTIRGLTTAASIWITAAIGILFGVGLYFPATLATIVTVGILSLFHHVERWMPKHSYVHFNISFDRKHRMQEEELRTVLKEYGFSIGNISYHIVDDGEISEYRSVIRTKDHSAVKRLAEHLIALEIVHEFKIAPSGD